jgi:hypothetical protein
VYPAGGQQGTVVRITVGGQHLNGVSDAVVSGTGVRATFIAYEGAGGPLNAAQRDLLRLRIQALIAQRTPAPAQPKVAVPTAPAAAAVPASGAATTAVPGAAAAPAIPPLPVKPPVILPVLPELRNLDQMTIKQLRQVADKFLNRQKQTKPPIAEEVTLEITIAPGATPGDRELRLLAPYGLSNPLIFQVGSLPELREKERNDDAAVAPPPADVPVVLNGQIMPGEVDRFPLKLHGGQTLLIAAQARHLIPYMADAVPGWCQAVLALYDANGTEVAYADDNSFDPDPSLSYQAPRDGEYQLAIRDALYRGREDFVYRVTLRAQTPADSPFPFAELGRVSPGAAPADINPLLPFVDSQLPLIAPEHAEKHARKIALPQLIKSRIAHPGDTNVFRFTGKAGQTVVAEIYARRLGSPMDALLRLRDANGHVLAWNDDHETPEMGLITHQADSYLAFKLPSDGSYDVQVSDAQHHGGAAYNYYLRVSPPQPDFALRLTPSGVNVPAGGKTTLTVYAFRKDGWDGDIDLTLQDAPAGFTLSTARIPAGNDHASITLTAPRQPSLQPLILHLSGHATIAGAPLTRPVAPADRLMQAFAYYHLVPAQELMVMVTRR